MTNRVVELGRITNDLEIKKTQNKGTSVLSFGIAVDRNGIKDSNGNPIADFLDVVCWGKTAEFVYKWFRKGSMISIDGKLQSRRYEDSNGKSHKVVEIIADNVSFTGEKAEATGTQINITPDVNDDFKEITEDDLPF